MKMSWGMYAGLSVTELPTAYLVWCLESCNGMHELLASAMRQELAARAAGRPEPDGCPLPGVLRSWRKRVFREFHPDRNGGDERTFVRVAAAVDDLLSRLRELGVGV